MELSLSQQLDDIATESLEIEPEDIIVMHKQQHVLPVEKSENSESLYMRRCLRNLEHQARSITGPQCDAGHVLGFSD